MSRGKRQHDGALMGWELGHVIAMITGEWLDPESLNPFHRARPSKPKSEAQRDRESKAAWALLDSAWGRKTARKLN